MQVLLALFILVVSGCAPVLGAEVRLSVAMSMTDVTRELVAAYHQQVPGVSVLSNVASSGSLARQISLGARADIYMSANSKWMTYLVEQGQISEKSVRTFAGNSLVFIGRKGLPVRSMGDVAGLRTIAIGSPRSSPAGQYAEQALKAAGVYERVLGKLVLAKDVRQALVYADRGETDGAFVYRTDAVLAQSAVILFRVPQALYPPIVLPIALTRLGAGNIAAVTFYEFLRSAEAAAIVAKNGFLLQ